MLGNPVVPLDEKIIGLIEHVCQNRKWISSINDSIYRSEWFASYLRQWWRLRGEKREKEGMIRRKQVKNYK